MSPARPAVRGRGAVENPPNRFERLRVEIDADAAVAGDGDELGAARPALRTQFYRDVSSTVLVRNLSPDVGFEWGLNPYRGCEHGCAYCYARPTHEFLGFSAGLDFETRIMVKDRAPELLQAELTATGWRPVPVAMSGVTDCYQPVERQLRLTRGCLEVFAALRHPVGIVTKNRLVVRDLDVLADLARDGLVRVMLSLTTLDAALARALEPRTSSPSARLEAVRTLADAGVPVGVNLAPIIPGLNDHEIPSLLDEAARCGAQFAGYQILRLPLAVKDVFLQWLDTHVPTRRASIEAKIRDTRHGALNVAAFGERMRGTGALAAQLGQLFRVMRRRAGLDRPPPPLRTDCFRPPGGVQLELGV
jgi:DNA repair photolyase